MDTVSRTERSRVMSLVKQRDSRIELLLRHGVWRAGIRYRKHPKILGTPDFAVRGARVVVFVDSCFWHACRYHCRRPKSNVAFWERKLKRNRERDKRITRKYRRLGWTPLRFWEHRVLRDLEGCVECIVRAVRLGRRRLRTHPASHSPIGG